jgi:hypothetical protein
MRHLLLFLGGLVVGEGLAFVKIREAAAFVKTGVVVRSKRLVCAYFCVFLGLSRGTGWWQIGTIPRFSSLRFSASPASTSGGVIPISGRTGTTKWQLN